MDANRPCDACKRSVNARLPVCPFCGHRFAGAPAKPADPAATGAPLTGAKAPRPVAAGTTSARPGTACVRCGALSSPARLLVEAWKEVFTWSFNKRKFQILSTKLPFCAGCRGWLVRQRLLSSGLVLVPLVILAGFASRAGTTLMAAVASVYGLYLFRSGGWGWADTLLYGSALEESAGASVPRHPEGNQRVRFPGSFTWGGGRFFVALLIGGGAFLGSQSSGGSTRSTGGIGIAEILDDGHNLYLPLSASDAPTMRFDYRTSTARDGRKVRLAVALQRPPGTGTGSYEDVSSWRALSEVRADVMADGLLLERTNGEEVVILREDFEGLLGQLRPDRPGSEPVIRR